VKLVSKQPQMSKQLELPQAPQSEALQVPRSEEAVTAGNESDGSGTLPLMAARNLNSTNRLVRPRMPGGVAGDRRRL
jgi:hypothetical protein